MVAIPQFQREFIRSSVVGTPGVDTSGAAIGESVAQGAGQLFQAAAERQSKLDIAEASLIQAKNKGATQDLLEQVKDKYANDPDAADKAFWAGTEQLQQRAQAQATNPRVKLMVGQKDPYFFGRVSAELGSWQYQQKSQLAKQGIMDEAQNIIGDAGKIIADPNKNETDKAQSMNLIMSRVGSIQGGAYAAAHPAEADKFMKDTKEAIGTEIYNRYLDNNPIMAASYANSDHAKDLIPDDAKRQKMITEATKYAETFQERKANEASANELLNNVPLMNKYFSGSMKLSDMYALPPSPLRDSMIKGAMASNPEIKQEVDAVMDTAMSKAYELGLTNVKGEKKVSPSQNLEDLVNFQKYITDNAVVLGDKAKSLNERVAAPLVAAAANAHAPNLWDNVRQTGEKAWAFVTKDPTAHIENFNDGYGVINNYLKASGMAGEDLTHERVRLMTQFINESHKIGAEQPRDVNGQPYTSTSLAHYMISPDFREGKTWPTPIGPLKIHGIINGVPQFDLQGEDAIKWQEYLAKQKEGK